MSKPRKQRKPASQTPKVRAVPNAGAALTDHLLNISAGLASNVCFFTSPHSDVLLPPDESAKLVRDYALAILTTSTVADDTAMLLVPRDSELFAAAALNSKLGPAADEHDDRLTEGELAARAASLLLCDPSIEMELGMGQELEATMAQHGEGRLEDLRSALFYVLREIARVHRAMESADQAAAQAAHNHQATVAAMAAAAAASNTHEAPANDAIQAESAADAADAAGS